MNKCIFMGRLTRNPEIRYTGGEQQIAIANFSIAVDRRRKFDAEQETDFFNCAAFSRKAEFVENYLRSGMRVLVSGRMQTNNYTNKNGEKVYGVELLVDEVEFADGKKEQQGDSAQIQSAAVSDRTSQGAGYAAPNSVQKQASITSASDRKQGSSGTSQNNTRTPSRQAAGRQTGYHQPSRRSALTGTTFMNIPDGVEDEGLPFN